LATNNSELGVPTDPEYRLYDLLQYTWQINYEAKGRIVSYLAGKYRYNKKSFLLDELCRLAAKQESYKWGWKKDPNHTANQPAWVLYFERDGIQCSFHAFQRGEGFDFDGEWDRVKHRSFSFKKFQAEGVPLLFKPKKRRKPKRKK
jgi:hypothetical protein